MSRHAFRMTAASMALIAGLGGAVLAQDATAPASPAPTGTTAADAATDAKLPALIEALGLQDIETRQGPRGGMKVEGDLAGGGEITAFVDADGALAMVKADDAALPQSLIDGVLPQAVRDSALIAQFATIEAVGARDGRVMVGGLDADGEELRAGFDEDGRLMRFGRGDDDREGRGPGGWGEGRGKGHEGRGPHRGEGAGDGDGPGHGRKGHGDEARGEHRGPGKGGFWGGGHEGRGGPDGMGPRDGARGPMIDAAALTKTLEDAGYSALSEPSPAGPRLLVEATNPSGEAVLLEVDPAGEVVRETAR